MMKAEVQKVMKDLEKIRREEDNPFWNVSPETGKFLYMMVKATGAKKVLEIGTSNGYSGLWLGAALLENGGELLTIESFIHRFNKAKENFKKAGLEGVVRQVLGHAPEVFEDITDSFDFAFFDATKAEHISYLEAVLPKLKDDGVIIVDNVISHKEQLKEFFKYVDSLDVVTSTKIPIGMGLLMITKG